VQKKGRNKKRPAGYPEEWKTSNTGSLPCVWNQGIQDWSRLIINQFHQCPSLGGHAVEPSNCINIFVGRQGQERNSY